MHSTSISGKLILITLTVWALVAVPGALWELSTGLARQHNDLQRTQQHVRQRLGSVLSEMLWNMDVPGMRSLMETELIAVEVAGVQIVDAIDQTAVISLHRNASGQIKPEPIPNGGAGLVRMDIDIRHTRGAKIESIGTVVVWFDPEPGRQSLRHGLLVDIGGSLAVITLLCVALVLVLHRNLIKPIEQIRQRMNLTRQLSPGRPPPADPLPNGSFGELRNMAEDLEAMLADLGTAAITVAERERLYRTLFDGGVDAVMVLAGTTVREANQRCEQLFGFAPGGLVGQEVTAMAPAQQPDSTDSAAVFAVKLSEADGCLFPWRAVRTDGLLIDMEIALGRVVMAGVPAVLASLRDVTDRNHLDAQLRQVQKMETIGQLAGGVAHDFNNALAAIIGSAELLQRFREDPQRVDLHSKQILDASERAATLVRQLLAFSRRQGGSSTPLDVHLIIRDTVALLQRTILDQRITIDVRLESMLTTVVGDSAMLQNALLNLGVNARDAMPAGGTITFATRLYSIDAIADLTTATVLPPGEYLEVAVIDTGTGMNEEVQRRCFEAFFTTKDPGKGTGLGLAAVAKTIQDHGGSIMIDTSVGHGTTFRVWLPVTAQQGTPKTPNDPRPARTGVGRILVVDDDQLIREISCQLLISLGYTVIEADDGITGVSAWFEQGPFDLLLVDMEMPGMRGVDCLQAIRARDPLAKALLCSGFSRDGDSSLLRAEGFLGFLNKPYRLRELSTTILAALQGRECFPAGEDLPRSGK